MTDSAIHIASLSGTGDELAYVEMVSADDVARLMRLESIESRLPAPEPMAFTYGLFGHDFEKGVVFRASCAALDRRDDEHSRSVSAIRERTAASGALTQQAI